MPLFDPRNRDNDIDRDGVVSIPHTAFKGQNPDTDDIDYSNAHVNVNAALALFAPVFLPEGVTVIKAIVYGNAGAEDDQFFLQQVDHAAGAVNIVVQNINTFGKDTNNAAAFVENGKYSYSLRTGTLAIGDDIYGASIYYTKRGTR